jgi:hypothetical protein
MNAVIYTAITGKKDELLEPEPSKFNPEFDYVCFTDNPRFKSRVWRIVHIPVINGDYNRSAKRYKILPHLFLPKYEYSIWVDGNCTISGDYKGILRDALSDSDLAFFRHRYVRCGYSEAQICINRGKDCAEIIEKQIEHYAQQGYPRNWGNRIDGGMIFRRHNRKAVKEIMDLWWSEINLWSRRDQISFNYLAWKHGFEYKLIPYPQRFKYVKQKHHLHKD